MADHVTRYALQFTRLTRKEKGDVPEFIRKYVSWGAGPRASQYLVLAAKARAVLHGRYFASCDDVRAVAPPGAAASHPHQFQRRGRGRQAGRSRPAAHRHDSLRRFRQERRWKTSPKYFDPQTLAKLRGLELRGRLIVEGYVSGVHRSPFHGFSVEFAEHREYVPGDDVRYVDWKVFGKTDKYYLKQYEEETNLISYLLARCQREHGVPQAETPRCRSSNTPSASPRPWPILILHQQDSVGLVTFDKQVPSLVRGRAAIRRT